jgi:hypothetical protein
VFLFYFSPSLVPHKLNYKNITIQLLPTPTNRYGGHATIAFSCVLRKEEEKRKSRKLPFQLPLGNQARER